MIQPTPDQLADRINDALSRTAGFIGASVHSRDPVVIAVAFTDRDEAHRYWGTHRVNEGCDKPRASIASENDTTVLLEWPETETTIAAATVPIAKETKAKSGLFSKAEWWPAIPNRETARKVARNGFWAAIFVVAVNAVFATMAVFGTSLMGMTPAAFVDVAIFCVLAIGIRKMFRTAAVAALVLFVIEKVLWVAEAASSSQTAQSTAFTIGPILVTLAITAAFVNSVRATFAYYKLQPEPVQPREDVAEVHHTARGLIRKEGALQRWWRTNGGKDHGAA